MYDFYSHKWAWEMFLDFNRTNLYNLLLHVIAYFVYNDL